MFSRTMILAAVATFAALPMAASATSLYHSAPGEAGFTEHPDHLTSSKRPNRPRPAAACGNPGDEQDARARHRRDAERAGRRAQGA